MTEGKGFYKSDSSRNSSKKHPQNKPWYELTDQDDFPSEVADWVTEQLRIVKK